MELNLTILTNKFEDKIYLPDNLRYLRETVARMDQRVFAETVGFKKTTYNNYETGHSNPNYLDLIKLSRLYGCNVDDLLYNDISKLIGSSYYQKEEVLDKSHYNSEDLLAVLRELKTEQGKIAINLQTRLDQVETNQEKLLDELRNFDVKAQVEIVRAQLASGELEKKNTVVKQKASEKK